jgi:hypothetical protein
MLFLVRPHWREAPHRKIKTISDAYMAAAGLPSPRSTLAKDAALLVLEMAPVVQERKAKK